MRVKRTLTTIALLAGAARVATGCSTVSTESDQVSLAYNKGSFSSKTFDQCIPASTREVDGPSDQHFVYPTSQRVYAAIGKDKGDADVFTVVSKDNAELRQPVTVTFTLNTDCTKRKINGKDYPGGVLQYFHELLGNRYAAYWNSDDEGDAGSDGAPAGWVNLLNFAIGQPLDTTLDRAAQNQNWRDLWNNPATKAVVEKEVASNIQAIVDSQTGAPADIHFFTNFKVLLQKPDPTNAALKEAVSSEQANVAKAQSAKAQADADRAAAEAQVAVARARAEATKAEVGALGPDAWIRKYAIDNDMNPFPPPVIAGQAAAPQQGPRP
jgi:hypothetical protein